METQVDKHTQPVEVTLGVTTDDGQSTTDTKTIPSGATKVPILKAELGVPVESALWLVPEHGPKRVLGDHESHNVKQGDHYEALVKGGVS